MSYIPASVQVMTMYNVDLTQPINTTFLLGKTRHNQTFIPLAFVAEGTNIGAGITAPNISLGTIAGSYIDVATAQPLVGWVTAFNSPPYLLAGINNVGGSPFVSIQGDTEIYLQIAVAAIGAPITANVSLLGITYAAGPIIGP